MDWDDAYANAAHIPGSDAFPPRWSAAAAAFRAAHPPEVLSTGSHPRETVDLIRPEGPARGLVVFIHGGYWLRFDPSYWTHFLAGPLAEGWAVALPGYPLCPEVDVPAITRSVARSVAAVAARVPDGPVRIAGHSAGGHLAARMVCADTGLGCRSRVDRVVPISPVADLRELQKTAMAGPLHLTDASAAAESPVLHPAPEGVAVTVWVGADERPVFLDQARWLGAAWSCPVEVEAGRHHFDIVDGLADPAHPLCRALTG